MTTPDGRRVQVRYLANPDGTWVNGHLVQSLPEVEGYALVLIVWVAVFVTLPVYDNRRSLHAIGDVQITLVAIGFAIVRDVLLLGPDKGPDFVALDALAGQIADGLAVVDGAGRANVYKELGHRVDRANSKAGDSEGAQAFNEEGGDLGAVRVAYFKKGPKNRKGPEKGIGLALSLNRIGLVWSWRGAPRFRGDATWQSAAGAKDRFSGDRT